MYDKPSIQTSASYADIEGASSTSGSVFIPRVRNVQSAPTSTIDTTDRKKKRRKRGDSSIETQTSGYSTNSLSEMSEFTNSANTKENRRYKPNPTSRRPQSDNDRNSGSERVYSENETRYNKRVSKDDRHAALGGHHKRSDSKLSINDSDISSSSKERTRKNAEKDKRGSSTSLDSKVHTDSKSSALNVPTSLGNVSVTVTNNIQYDPNDPFSFIQPVDLPFHVKVKKCVGPILAVILLLILAGALGAAIFFASAYSEKQELQEKVDVLSANLAMKIRHAGYNENIDNLSTQEFKELSSTYCKQMDIFYTKSQFKNTYRGCEVLSIQNRFINFTLFFVEKEASKSQIVAVIETSATKVENETETLAVVDKFELELDSVKVSIERRMEPETFNKKIAPPKPTTVKPVKTTLEPIKVKTTSKVSTKMPVPTNRDTGKKIPPRDKPVYLWEPCKEYEGTYFPHPTRCEMFFQCTNGETIEHTCTPGLLYHWKELTCVSRFMPNVQCPDASKAPPRPTTKPPSTTTMAPKTSPTVVSSTDSDFDFILETTRSTTTTSSALDSSLSAKAGSFEGRPEYPADPCTSDTDGNLYPHPKDCALFIQCVNGKVMNMACAPTLVFDPVSNACIFPKNKDLICPDTKPCEGKNDGYFPHPYDCSKFIQCQFGKEKVLSCPNELQWDKKVHSCVHNVGGVGC